jgi:hypothetical protein
MAEPEWTQRASGSVFAYLSSQGKSRLPQEKQPWKTPDSIDPRMKEDCLFLNVLAPKNVLDNTLENIALEKKAPVIGRSSSYILCSSPEGTNAICSLVFWRGIRCWRQSRHHLRRPIKLDPQDRKRRDFRGSQLSTRGLWMARR